MRHDLRIEIAPRTIFLVLGVIAGVWLLGQLGTVLSIVVVALVLVGTFDPVVAWFERRGLARGRALVLLFVAGALVVTGLVLLMVRPLFSQFMDLLGNAPKERERIILAMSERRWTEPLADIVRELPIDDLGHRAGNALLGYSTRVLATVGYALTAMFLAIYLLADPVRSKGFVYALVPRVHHVKVAKILLELKVIVGGYMRGQMITSLAIAVFVFLLLTILGADNALAIALFAGLTDIIPFIGGLLASTPVVLAVLPHGATTVFVVVVLMVLYQEFENRVLVPRVYGRVLRLQPALVVIALLVGGTLGGILGALLSLPIAAGLQMVFRELRVDLPGEVPPKAETVQRDQQATEVYQHLAEGAPAAEAGAIADEIATTVKRGEDQPTK